MSDLGPPEPSQVQNPQFLHRGQVRYLQSSESDELMYMLTYALVVNAMISTACTSPILSLARFLLALPVGLPVAATFAVLGRCFKHNRKQGADQPAGSGTCCSPLANSYHVAFHMIFYKEGDRWHLRVQ